MKHVNQVLSTLRSDRPSIVIEVGVMESLSQLQMDGEF